MSPSLMRNCRYSSRVSLPGYGGMSSAQLLDDLCFRTLLSASEGASYAFIHKSFQEYFIARYVFECMRMNLTPRS